MFGMRTVSVVQNTEILTVCDETTCRIHGIPYSSMLSYCTNTTCICCLFNDSENPYHLMLKLCKHTGIIVKIKIDHSYGLQMIVSDFHDTKE